MSYVPSLYSLTFFPFSKDGLFTSCRSMKAIVCWASNNVHVDDWKDWSWKITMEGPGPKALMGRLMWRFLAPADMENPPIFLNGEPLTISFHLCGRISWKTPWLGDQPKAHRIIYLLMILDVDFWCLLFQPFLDKRKKRRPMLMANFGSGKHRGKPTDFGWFRHRGGTETSQIFHQSWWLQRIFKPEDRGNDSLWYVFV